MLFCLVACIRFFRPLAAFLGILWVLTQLGCPHHALFRPTNLLKKACAIGSAE